MTAVDFVTGEIVGDLSADEARKIVARVKAGVDTIRTDIIALWQGRAWIALGVESWESLCDNEFGVRMALPRDERVAIVTDLTEKGMSTRAIGSALGVDHTTVMEDVRRGGNPPPDEISGTDGKTYIRNPSTSRGDTYQPASVRAAQIRELAADGNSSGQIGAAIGVSEERVRLLARENDIAIPADSRTRTFRIDHDRVLGEAVYALDGLRSGLKALDLNGLTEAGWQRCHDEEWVTSLVESRRALTRLIEQLREITQ